MPNAVTAKRNLPNWGADARLDICQILENKGFFSRGGGGGRLYLGDFGFNACGLLRLYW